MWGISDNFYKTNSGKHDSTSLSTFYQLSLVKLLVTPLPGQFCEVRGHLSSFLGFRCGLKPVHLRQCQPSSSPPWLTVLKSSTTSSEHLNFLRLSSSSPSQLFFDWCQSRWKCIYAGKWGKCVGRKKQCAASSAICTAVLAILIFSLRGELCTKSGHYSGTS